MFLKEVLVIGNYRNIETSLIHDGIYGDKQTGAVNIPIYQTSTYEQEELASIKDEYSVQATLQGCIGSADCRAGGGAYGYAFASGMAAITAA